VPDEHAVLIERDGRCTLRFQRRLSHPPERVWRALTEHDMLAAWHPTPFHIEGESIEFTPSAGIPDIAPGRVLAIELCFTLQEQDDGCLLTLEHTFEDRFKAARDGAGWHLCLRALGSSLDGRAEASSEDDGLPNGWSELNTAYQRRFGIAPEQATPVPPR
jgi:uncharacterized protein YndB with AHSA1/START domain